MVKQGLFSVAEVSAMIENGDVMIVTGDVYLLSVLPKGNWIGSTNINFILNSGEMLTSKDKLFVFNLTEVVKAFQIQAYTPSTIHNVYDDAYDNGFTVLLHTWGGETYSEYALKVSDFNNFATKLVCGWVTTGYYDDAVPCFVVSGKDLAFYRNHSVALHIELPDDQYAELHTFSPYKPGKGDVFTFDENCLQCEYAYINGERQRLKDYFKEHNIPRNNEIILAGNYIGSVMNTYIKRSMTQDAPSHVYFTAPVYKGIEYRVVELEPAVQTPDFEDDILLSYSCITNSERPELFKFLKHVNGPFVWGEVAYYTMNMATCYLTIGHTTN